MVIVALADVCVTLWSTVLCSMAVCRCCKGQVGPSVSYNSAQMVYSQGVMQAQPQAVTHAAAPLTAHAAPQNCKSLTATPWCRVQNKWRCFD